MWTDMTSCGKLVKFLLFTIVKMFHRYEAPRLDRLCYRVLLMIFLDNCLENLNGMVIEDNTINWQLINFSQ